MNNQGAASLNKRGEKGFTLFELLVSAVMLGILALFLLDRMLTYQEMAEKTTVEMTVMNMRTGLRYQIAEYMTQNRDNEIDRLAGENPVKWLESPPPNYLGELSKPRSEDIPPGSWYFDLSKRALCYRVNKSRNFVSEQSGKKTMCLHVTALNNGGATLTLEEAYRWF